MFFNNVLETTIDTNISDHCYAVIDPQLVRLSEYVHVIRRYLSATVQILPEYDFVPWA
jgi:hypothetical protein